MKKLSYALPMLIIVSMMLTACGGVAATARLQYSFNRDRFGERS